MSGIAKVLLFMVNCVLTNNFIFSRYLGNCPFLGVSNKVETATGMGLAVTFVMGLASLFTYLIYTYILVPLGLSYLSTIVFILVIASLVQIVEMFIKKSSPSLYKALGIYLPNINPTTPSTPSASTTGIQSISFPPYAPRPAKPMNATDIRPAIISELEKPLRQSGILEVSSLSLTPAISTMASRKPSAPNMPLSTE